MKCPVCGEYKPVSGIIKFGRCWRCNEEDV
jgi:hypothetical protein